MEEMHIVEVQGANKLKYKIYLSQMWMEFLFGCHLWLMGRQDISNGVSGWTVHRKDPQTKTKFH